MCLGPEIMMGLQIFGAVSSAVSLMNAGDEGGSQQAAAPAAPAQADKPPQGATQPDEVARRSTKSGTPGGAAGTLLAGAGGIPPSLLNLGKPELMAGNMLGKNDKLGG